MPTFQIQTKDAAYEVDAPDEATAVSALGLNAPAEQVQQGRATFANREAVPSAEDLQAAAREKDVGARVRNLQQGSLGGFAGQWIAGAPFTADILAGVNAPVRALQRAYQGKDSVGLGEEASREKEAVQRVQQGYADQNPNLALAGRIGGGLSLGGPRLGPGGAVAPVMPSTVAGSAAANAGLGAAYGASEGDTLGERAANAAIGAGVGGVLGAGVGKLAEVAARPATASTSAVIDAGNSVGVGVPRFLATDSKAVQMGAQAGRQSLIGGPKIESAAKGFIEDVGNAAENTAKSVGSADALTAGEGAAQGLTNTVKKTIPQKVSNLYEHVDSLVDPTIKTPLDATRAAAGDILSKLDAATLDNSSAVGRVAKAIGSTATPSRVMMPGGTMATIPGQPVRNALTVDGIKTLRSSIGEMIDTGILPADMRRSELKQIYRGLTQDLKTALMNAGGEDALKAWTRANTYRAAAQSRMDALAKVVGADGANRGELVFSKLEAMAKAGAAGDIRTLQLARRSMPSDQWNDVVSAVVQKLGRASDGTFSADKFVTEYSKLTPNGKATLFGGNQNLMKSLDAINTLAGRSKEATKYANHSNTGRTLTGAGWISGFMAHPVTAIAGALGAETAARILSKPATAQAAAQWAQRVKSAQRAGVQGASIAQRVSQQFGATVAKEMGIPQAANDFGLRLMGQTKSAADENSPQ